ncbi:hypothetical protein PAHAL_3G267100 [Panicum hallii]|uniref:Uncharacterized protein n=1 Tax=Panicum hallii TaxID=206008 RepID=A0A2T8KJI2_9POAL|nr:hypothetical protein PAHAL_3G267100 [Panicum hallii]
MRRGGEQGGKGRGDEEWKSQGRLRLRQGERAAATRRASAGRWRGERCECESAHRTTQEKHELSSSFTNATATVGGLGGCGKGIRVGNGPAKSMAGGKQAAAGRGPCCRWREERPARQA